MITKFEVGKKYINRKQLPKDHFIECVFVTPKGKGVCIFWDKSEGVYPIENCHNWEEYVEPKKAWINLYPNQRGSVYTGVSVHASKEEADKSSYGEKREACIEITWKPGDGL